MEQIQDKLHEMDEIKHLVDDLKHDQVYIDERELYTRMMTTKIQLEESGLPRQIVYKLKKIIEQIELVLYRQAGETVGVYLDDDFEMFSKINTGRSRYVYITDSKSDDNVVVETNYQECIMDIFGQIKDGNVHYTRLYSRKNWNFETGDPILDQHEIKWLVNGEAIGARDLEILSLILDDKYNLENYIDVLSTAKISPDETISSGDGKNYVIVQDRISGKVTNVNFDCPTEILDLVLNDVLLELSIV